jgi:hemoglobin-like flavoprotein
LLPGRWRDNVSSYLRCSQEGFYRGFYGRLLESDSRIGAMFAHTDFTRQNKLLKHALGLLLAYGVPGNGRILEQIAERHGPADLDIEPSLYPVFVECLIATVKEYDPQYTRDLELSWRRALEPGIAFLASFGRGARGASSPS